MQGESRATRSAPPSWLCSWPLVFTPESAPTHPSGLSCPEKPQQPALGSISAPEASGLPKEPASGCLSAGGRGGPVTTQSLGVPSASPLQGAGVWGLLRPPAAPPWPQALRWGSRVPLPQLSGEGEGKSDGPRASVSGLLGPVLGGGVGGVVTNLRGTGSEGLLWDT